MPRPGSTPGSLSCSLFLVPACGCLYLSALVAEGGGEKLWHRTRKHSQACSAFSPPHRRYRQVRVIFSLDQDAGASAENCGRVPLGTPDGWNARATRLARLCLFAVTGAARVRLDPVAPVIAPRAPAPSVPCPLSRPRCQGVGGQEVGCRRHRLCWRLSSTAMGCCGNAGAPLPLHSAPFSLHSPFRAKSATRTTAESEVCVERAVC